MTPGALKPALSPNDRVRIAAIDLLVQRGADAVVTLVGQLSDESWVVRRRLVTALAELGDVATEPLCELLAAHRPNEAAIAAAVDALSASTGRPEVKVAELTHSSNAAVVCDAAQILGRRRASSTVPLLKGLLSHPDDNVAVAAVEALGRIGGEQALDAVMSVASSGNFFRVFPTIELLGESADFRAVSPLLTLLADPLYESAAARALGRLGGTRAVQALMVKLASATDPEQVGVFGAALAEIGVRPVDAPQVIDAVRSSDVLLQKLRPLLAKGSSEEKIHASRLLGWARNPAATEALVPLLDGPRPVAESAAQTLAALAHESTAEVSELLRAGPSARRAVLIPNLRERRFATDIVECLRDPDPTVRAAACGALAGMGSAEFVSHLFPLLSDSDMRVSQAALAAIQSLGSAQTQTLTLQMATSADPRLQRAAFRIIGYFGYAAALDVTVKGSQSADSRVRDAAVQALAYITHPRASQTLLKLAAAPNPQVRATAVRALGHSLSFEASHQDAVRAGLSDGDSWVRYYACQSVGRLGDTESKPRLLELVKDEAGQVRVAAIEALARLGTHEAFEAIVTATGSDDHDLRRAALLALGQIGDPAGTPVLIRALELPDPSTRLVALSALHSLGGSAALPAIMRAAGDADDGVRTAAIALLAGDQTAGSTEALISLLGDKALQPRVLSALSVTSGPRIAGVLDALESAEGEAAGVLVEALRAMPQNAGWRALLSALQNAGAPGRRAAARVLALSTSADARAALQRASTTDPEPDIRRLCQLALGTP